MELSPLLELIRNVQKFNNYLYCNIQYTKSEVWPSFVKTDSKRYNTIYPIIKFNYFQIYVKLYRSFLRFTFLVE